MTSDQPESPDRWLSMAEAADLINTRYETLRKNCDEWQVPYYRVGRIRKFRLAEVQAWLISRRVAA